MARSFSQEALRAMMGGGTHAQQLVRVAFSVPEVLDAEARYAAGAAVVVCRVHSGWEGQAQRELDVRFRAAFAGDHCRVACLARSDAPGKDAREAAWRLGATSSDGPEAAT